MRLQFLSACLEVLVFVVIAYFIIVGFIVPAAQGLLKLLAP